MRKITSILFVLALGFAATATAQQTCVADPTKAYFTTNAGWSQSEYYEIINIDAEKLTPSATGLAAHTGSDGSATSTSFSTGAFTTPIMTTEDGVIYTPTSVNWPVNFYMASLTNSFFNSSYTKVEMLGTNPSGGATDPCYFNNNSIIQSPIWNKKGFIELSRLAAASEAPEVSRHGYIVINDLPQVERVQWSFSSTSWKRGVKLDIKHGDGEWQPLRWEPSDIANSLVSFAEQGYAFVEMINKEEDPTSKISLRWRIWDGDSIHINPTKDDGSTFGPINPLAQRQVARIHQIKIYSGVIPESGPNSVRNTSANFMKIYRSGSEIILSETANVELYSYDGKKIFSGSTSRINISNVPQGVYVVRAINQEGKIQNQKITL